MTEPNPPELVLHTWPPQWGLPSLDPQCIAAVIYMQLTFPGRYSVVECTDPDQSPSGQLPFLTHELQEVSPLPSIISYLEALARAEAQSSEVSIDTKLKLFESPRAVAWKAYITSQLGDILSHQLYVEHYWAFTRGSLAKLMPFPHKLYVPGRLRKIHRPRLEAIGIWDPHFTEEPETPKPTTKTPQRPGIPPVQAFKRAFTQEKILDKARTAFDLLKNLLGERDFIYGDSPTTVDIMLASYILPLLHIPFPNATISSELRESYGTLVAHAERILECAQVHAPAPVFVPPSARSSLAAVINGWRMNKNVFAREKEKPKGSAAQKEASLRYGKWLFGLVAGVGSVVYLIVTGIISVQVVDADEDHTLDVLDIEEEE